MTERSVDSLFSGEIICCQNKHGYRFSVDPVLLCHFTEVSEGDRILDLGAGCGVISLILLYRYQELIDQITGIEIQAALCSLADYNHRTNKLGKKARIVKGNIKQIGNYFSPESFDKIICNPPFFTKESGRQSDNDEARLARHQIAASLQDFLSAGAYCLKNRGDAYFIYPAEQINEFLLSAARYRMEPKKLQFVYSYPEEEKKAKLVLVKCVKNGKSGVEVLAPFYIYAEKNGSYSQKMLEYYGKN